MGREPASARDTVFAALALLRCRDHIEQILGTICEPRRSELVWAVSELADVDDGQLRRLLIEVMRREDRALEDSVAQTLGSGVQAPLAVRRWIARGLRR